MGYQILEFHVERTQGAHVPRGVSGWADSEGRGIWGVSCMIGLPEKNMLWMDFKSSSKYNASVSDCFLENQRNSASPRVLWRLCGLHSEVRNPFCRLSQTLIPEPSRSVVHARGPRCAVEVGTMSLWMLSLSQVLDCQRKIEAQPCIVLGGKCSFSTVCMRSLDPCPLLLKMGSWELVRHPECPFHPRVRK